MHMYSLLRIKKKTSCAQSLSGSIYLYSSTRHLGKLNDVVEPCNARHASTNVGIDNICRHICRNQRGSISQQPPDRSIKYIRSWQPAVVAYLCDSSNHAQQTTMYCIHKNHNVAREFCLH